MFHAVTVHGWSLLRGAAVACYAAVLGVLFGPALPQVAAPRPELPRPIT